MSKSTEGVAKSEYPRQAPIEGWFYYNVHYCNSITFDYMMNELLLAAIFLDADPIQPSIPPPDGPNQMANEGDALLSS